MSKTILNYKHRLYPTKTQTKLLNSDIFATNQTYNIVLNILQKEYQTYIQTKEFYNEYLIYHNRKPLKKIKFKWLSDSELDRLIRLALKNRDIYIPTDAMQGERKVAKNAFKDGFKKDKGEANFRRSEALHGAFNWANARTKLTNNKLLLSKRMGNIKIVREREFPPGSKIKTVRIKKENNQFFAVFTIEFELDIKEVNIYKEDLKIIGMDTNNGHLNFSDQTIIKYKRSLNMNELKKLKNKYARKLVKEIEKLDYLQKQQSKRLEKAKKNKEKVSKNFYKTQYKINKIQTKQKNRRKNLLDGLSNEILSKAFDVLSVEKLDVKSMTSKKNDNKNKIMPKQKVKQMRKNILNFSYSILHNMLLYKAPLMNKLVIQINPEYTTSSCCECGNIQKLELSDRIFDCEECSNIRDRDDNSSINIEHRGRIFLEGLTSSCLAL